MSTFSDGADDSGLPAMSGSPTYGLSTTGDMRFHLQNLLDNKEKQLQQAGTLGQQLLAQRMELEERIKQLQELDFDTSDGDDVDAGIREKYRELADTIKAWDNENDQLSSLFGAKQHANGAHVSPPSRSLELSRGELERSLEKSKTSGTGTTAAQSSRRAKNAAHRADDVEFAFEIGSGLLTEVRRLQSLLGERDKAIQDMKEEKDDLEKTVEGLRTGLRSQEQSADKYKEENWNLEVTLQELRAQLSDSLGTVQRLEGEQKRLTRLLANTRESVDQHKNEAERHQNAFLELKAKHETDVAQARKHAASLQRDKSDLQQSLDSMKAEMSRASKRLPRFGSPLTPNGAAASEMATPIEGDDDDIFSATAASTANKKKDTSAIFPVDGFDFADSSPENSPSRPFLAPNHPSNEIEALQQRLAHAQRQINTLKGTLQREKELRMDYRRKLDSSPGFGGDEEADEDYVDEEGDELKPKIRVTPYRAGRGQGRGTGRGRGRGGLTFTQRLGMAAHSPASEYADDQDLVEAFGESPPPPVPPLPSMYQPAEAELQEPIIEEEDEQEEEELNVPQSPSPAVASNRTSVDGMDPAFANVLRRSSSANSLPLNASPLRQTVLARPIRGGTLPRRRGGAAYQEARPASLVGQPEALAAELGFAMVPSMEDTLELPEVETAEFGCQTDFEEPPPRVVVVESPPPPRPTVAEFGIQVEPEPEPMVVRSEVALQTDEEPVPARAESGVQHEDSTPVPILVSTSMNTDPLPEPQPVAVDVVPQPISTPTLTFSQVEVQTQAVPSFDVDTQTMPESIPAVPEKADSETQTLPSLQPATGEMEIQTLPSEPPATGDMETQTLSLVLPATGEMETQTATVPSSNVEIQAVPIDVPVATRDQSADTSVGSSSGDTTVTVRPARASLLAYESYGSEDEDDDQTETGIETDAEDYLDARQSISLVTPTESLDDYHSIMTVTDNDFSESDDDGESIKASRLPSRQGMVGMSSVPVSSQPSPSMSTPPASAPAPTYESKAVSAEIIQEPLPQEPEPEELKVEEPKPEHKEMSIQTDEWTPPAPPAPPIAPIPTPAPSPALYRVGPNAQPFQFISPPPSTGPQVTSLPNVAAPSPSSALRESITTLIPRPRTSQSQTHDKRQSIESTLSSAMDDIGARSRTGSNVTSLIDKSRPPMMVLPPPPRQPPPPNTMLPPAFIPERRLATGSTASHDIPPPRPSSPPPVELIQRATTPVYGSVLSIPGTRAFGLRPHGSSVPPSQQGLRQPPSTSSFRSAANAAARAPQSSPSALSFNLRERREQSSTSLNSGAQSIGSQRSSISSDHHGYEQPAQGLPSAPVTPNHRPTDIPGRSANGASTDPVVIHAITQTMIGEFLYKYTRRAIGKGHGERRHKRFFWVHPYTRTLYWSSADPGSSNVSESSAKSAYIEGVRAVLDPNPMPPGIHQYSVIVSTPQREMKFTAPTKERHEIWVNALQYLLTRPGAMAITSPANAGPAQLGSPLSMDAELPDVDNNQRPALMSSPKSQRSARTGRTGASGDSWNTTPRGQRSQSQLSLGGSMGKRSGTPAAEYLRWAGPDGPHSPTKSFEHIPGHDDGELDFELHDETMSDGGFEGLENVRACCEGRHTVGRSGRHDHDHDHHHHHHHDHHQIHHDHPPPQAHSRRDASRTRDQHLDPVLLETARPASPAWSFRSRAGSTNSRDGGGFFSRFGTRRSKAVPSHDS